jgi:hypothetical protein
MCFTTICLLTFPDLLSLGSQINGGKVADPVGAAPRKQVLPSPSTIAGVKRVKIRSGPYKVPDMSKASPSGHRYNFNEWY